MALLLFLVCALCTSRVVSGITYVAGVVEFAPNTLTPSTDITPSQLILQNAERYLQIIQAAAKHDVDIIVFPECGLTSISVPAAREHILPYLTELPTVGVNPCEVSGAPKVLQVLSCAAKQHNMYTVVNLDTVTACSPEEPDCPADRKLFYNTNLAFDRNGTVVSKYRKFNLFVEPQFNSTQVADHSWFDTDFGLRFGMFICFDIMFAEPAMTLVDRYNISNFVYSTAWFSELPFLSAAAVQAAWSYASDVNLLAAGYSNTPHKNFGSGIYAGRDGQVAATMPEHSSTTLIIARLSDQRGELPSHTEQITFTEDKNSEQAFYHDDFTNYTTTQVTESSAYLEYNNEGFSCNITVTVGNVADRPVYRLVAFSGLRVYAGIRTVRIEVCAVVACTDSTLASCVHKPYFPRFSPVFSKLSITATSNHNLVSFPITADQRLLPLAGKSFAFTREKKNGRSEMKMKAKRYLKSFIAFGIFRN